MDERTLWLTIVAMGIMAYSLRLSFIALLGRVSTPILLEQALRYAAPAVLAALVAPALLCHDGQVNASLSNERLVAGVVALIVAWRSGSMLLTIGLGLAVVCLLQAVV